MIFVRSAWLDDSDSSYSLSLWFKISRSLPFLCHYNSPPYLKAWGISKVSFATCPKAQQFRLLWTKGRSQLQSRGFLAGITRAAVSSLFVPVWLSSASACFLFWQCSKGTIWKWNSEGPKNGGVHLSAIMVLLSLVSSEAQKAGLSGSINL